MYTVCKGSFGSIRSSIAFSKNFSFETFDEALKKAKELKHRMTTNKRVEIYNEDSLIAVLKRGYSTRFIEGVGK